MLMCIEVGGCRVVGVEDGEDIGGGGDKWRGGGRGRGREVGKTC